MALNFFLKRSGTASKRPDAVNMSLGEIDLNYDSSTGGIFYKDSAGSVVKVGPAEVGTSAPNSTPAGSAGNSVGEFWYDTATSSLFIWDGTSWVAAGGGAGVQGVTGTSPITVDNTDPANPIIEVAAASTANSGVVQLNDTTSSTSTTEAATANAVKNAYDLAAAAIPETAFTASGDVLYGTGSGTYSALGIGSAGQVLTVSGGNPIWSTPASPGVSSVSGTSPITVDNTDPINPVISIDAASTSAAGAVQLNDSVSSTSTTQALTAAQGKNLQDQISALTVGGGLTLAGTFNATTSQMVTVTASGTAQGFVVGSDLPSPAVGNTDYFVIVTTGGSYSPPGGGGPFTTSAGDWLLSSGTAWQFLNISSDYVSSVTAGTGLSGGTITSSGTIALLSAIPTAIGGVLGRTSTSTTALGCNALVSVAGGSGNAAVGINAGCSVTTGLNNTLMGACAGDSITSGGCNVAIGASAGCSVTTAGSNVFLGTSAGCLVSTGASNVAIGINAGCGVTTGCFNVAIGSFAQVASATGSCQLAIGFDSSNNWLTGDSTKAIRPGAGIADCAGSTGTSGQVLMSNGANALCWGSITAATPTAFGTVRACTPFNNTALGCNALGCVTSGIDNTFIGSIAGFRVTTGSYNVAIGQAALGGDATAAATPDSAVAIGQGALRNVTAGGGSCSVAIGTNAGRCSTSAVKNVLIGTEAGNNTTWNGDNVLIGYRAGCSITGICNVVVGTSGAPAGTLISNSIAIGHSTIINADNQVTIGRNAGPASATPQITLFNGTSGGVRLLGANTAWTFVSDARDKKDIEDLALGLDFIKEVKPRKFVWNKRKECPENGTVTTGFIAQEVQEVVEKFDAVEYAGLVETCDPDQLQLSDTKLLPILVQAVKELAAKNEELEARLAALEG